MVIYFHRTNIAERILKEGFCDHEEGVFLSNLPLNYSQGVTGNQLLMVALDYDITHYEWTDETQPYRQWGVPAGLLNLHAAYRLVSNEEEALLCAMSMDRLLRGRPQPLHRADFEFSRTESKSEFESDSELMLAGCVG